jgi:hypothetical protein
MPLTALIRPFMTIVASLLMSTARFTAENGAAPLADHATQNSNRLFRLINSAVYFQL